MVKISLQFHANRDEIASWLAEFVEEFGLLVATEAFSPRYHSQACSVGEFAVRLDASSDVSRVAMNLKPIDLSPTSSLGFLRSNPDVLTVTLGAQSLKELGETTLGAMTDDEQSLKVWRMIRKRVKASLLTGSSSVANPVTGVEQRARGHCYSAGARESAKRGVRLLAAAGWNEYRLDE